MTRIKHPHIDKKLCLLLLLLILGLLAACATQPQVKTPADNVAVAYATITGLADAVTEHVQAGVLSPEDGAYFAAKLKGAKQLTDGAYIALHDGLPDNAFEALRIVNRLLLELQFELQKKVEAQSK